MKSKKLTNFLKHARKEISKYNKTKKVTHLQQAGEKIWNAYIYLIESIKRKEIRTHKQVSNITRASKDNDIKRLYREASYLHTFFYESSGDAYWIKKSAYRAFSLFSRLRKRYKV